MKSKVYDKVFIIFPIDRINILGYKLYKYISSENNFRLTNIVWYAIYLGEKFVHSIKQDEK